VLYIIKKFTFYNFLLGNTKLEKWSASTLRRAGLCADHFNITSFKGEDKKVLKRDAVPIRFDVTYLQKETCNVINNDMIPKLQMTEKITQIEETRENNERMIDINEDVTPSTSSIDQNDVMEK